MADELRYEVSDGIATITLDRPDELNALTPRGARELVEAFDAVEGDDEVRAVVLTGAGRAFCAGADLSAGGSTFDYSEATGEQATIGGVRRDLGGAVVLAVAACTRPIVAAVNGAAVGIGATMLLPCDVRLAADRARFGFVFTRRGITLDGASSWYLPRIVGMARALEWTVTGRVFDAAEAHDGGLVSRIVPADELAATARGLATEIVENTSPLSVAVSRRLLWSMAEAPSPWDAHRVDTRVIARMGRGPDAAEGVTAFLEKRPPRFTARIADDLDDLVPPWPPRPPDVTEPDAAP